MDTKRILSAILVSALLMAPAFAQEDAAKAESGPALENEIDRINYWLGAQFGGNLKTIPFEINLDMVVRAIEDVLADRTPALNETEMAATRAAYQQKIQVEQAAVAAKGRAEGEAFLAANASKEGIFITESGLQYEILTAGSGPKPAATDEVKVHYRGTLLDGTEFDSSYKRNTPATFSVNRVIAGWTEALQLMGVGAKWRLFIPSGLAYGDIPRPGSPITPGAMLIFEVELLEIL